MVETAVPSESSNPVRMHGVDGHFDCYRCPGRPAVASARKKCCKDCLIYIVRRSATAELTGLRRRLGEWSLNKQEAVVAADGSVPISSDTSTSRGIQYGCLNTNSCHSGAAHEDTRSGSSLFIALSGGDASLSLLHIAAAHVQQKCRVQNIQLKQKGQGLPHVSCSEQQPATQRTPPAANFPIFDECVSIHVDMQRLFRPRAQCELAVMDCSEENKIKMDEIMAISKDAMTVMRHGVGLRTCSESSLPLQLQRTISQQWPSVRCVFLHPLGVEFDIIANSEGTFELYKLPGSTSCQLKRLNSLQHEEERLRLLIAQTLAHDRTAAEHLLKTIMMRTLSLHFSRIQRLIPDDMCDYRVSVERLDSCTGGSKVAFNSPQFLCFGDSSGAASLAVLDRVSFGEGMFLAMESASVDERYLPFFHLCRPLVNLSKKELALFRVFEKIASPPTRPFALVEEVLPLSGGFWKYNPRPSVRGLLQEYVNELEKDNPATVANILSSSRKLDAYLKEGDLRCRLCWKAAAVPRSGNAKDNIMSNRQKRILTEFLGSSVSCNLCFPCIRDATTSEAAALIANTLLSDVQICLD